MTPERVNISRERERETQSCDAGKTTRVYKSNVNRKIEMKKKERKKKREKKEKKEEKKTSRRKYSLSSRVEIAF